MPESAHKTRTYYDKLIEDTSRQLAICNACRYCEGFCAVWDAIEYRKEFSTGDISYLSNLCHDCGECFDVCPFVPPHEFNVDIPAALSEVRMHTYKEYASPRSAEKLYEKPLAVAGLIGGLSLIAVFALFVLTGNPSRLFGNIGGLGSFYVILPNIVIDVAGSMLALFFLVTWAVSGRKFLKDVSTGSSVGLIPFVSAIRDGLEGKWMQGGGAGCNYPKKEARGNYLKLTLHTMVLYGFLLDLLATTSAFIEQDFFGTMPPFPVISIPVISGIAGGILIILGASSFLYFDKVEEGPKKKDMELLDRVFLMALLFTAVTGLLLLALRSSTFMGIMLLIHISVVSTLFITAPYGKFVHLVYRSLATAKYHREKADFENSA